MIIHESIFLPKHLSLSLPEYLLYLYVKRIKRWFLHQCSASIQCVNVSDPAKLSCILPKSTTTTIGGWWLKNKTKNWEHLKWQLTATPPLHTPIHVKDFSWFSIKNMPVGCESFSTPPYSWNKNGSALQYCLIHTIANTKSWTDCESAMF